MLKNLLVRLAFYFAGLFIMTFAIALSVRSNLGVSPVSSIPYTLTCVWGVELGMATILFHLALIVLQAVLLRRDFKVRSLLQVPVGVVFGLFSSLCIALTGFIPAVDNVWVQLAMSLTSSLLLAFGIFLYVPADIMPLAGEGTMLAISKITKVKFSNVKIAFDVSMVLISLVTCLALIQSPGSVNIGTVIAAGLVGFALKAITKAFGPARDRILAGGAEPEAVAQTSPLAAIMETDVFTLRTDASYLDALRLFHGKGISGAPVVDAAGVPVGFISDGDVLRVLGTDHPLFVQSSDLGQVDFNDRLGSLLEHRVGETAIKRVISVNASDDLGEVCYCLAQNHLKKAPVMSGSKMVGIINRSNIIGYVSGLLAV